MLAMRDEIRKAVRNNRPKTGSFCYAAYVSPDASLCDCENVLFYNVDTRSGTFAHFVKAGVCFERVVGQPPETESPIPFMPQHYHRYEINRDSIWRFWEPEAVIGKLTAEFPSAEFSVHGVWYALRRGLAHLNVDEQTRLSAIARFGLRVSVANLSLTSTGRLKILLDGVVAAFHFHDGTQIQKCSRRLASPLKIDARSIETALTDRRSTHLGGRRLLWPRGKGVQWNPGDDLCVAATIHQLPEKQTKNIRIDAELIIVTAIH